jgi:hypothetical protein
MPSWLCIYEVYKKIKIMQRGGRNNFANGKPGEKIH